MRKTKIKTKSKFTRENFYGTVFLKDWQKHIDGRDYCGITGIISVYSDVEAVGFESKGGHNWMARIDGPTESFTILGCQIRSFVTHAAQSVVDRQFLVMP